jgi:hypothetical protein
MSTILSTSNTGTDAVEPREQDDEQKQEQEQEQDHCPICLTECPTTTIQSVSGPCRHSCCIDCMEQILNANGELTRWPPHSAADSHLSAPTLGRCPICRSPLSLFDVVDTTTHELLYPPQTEYHRNEDCPLYGSVYIPYHGKVGQLSFHWDWSKLKRKNNTELPFLNLSQPIRSYPEQWRLENGALAPGIKFFQEGCHFHPTSRTFHGTILWPDRLNGSHQWDVVLGFPNDYRFLSTGRIHKRRDLQKTDDQLPQDYTSEQKQQCQYPLDGRWTVSWKDRLKGTVKQSEIHVKNNEYVQSKWPFYLNFDDPMHPHVPWPKSEHRQTVQEGVNLTKEPLGPKVGDRIRWTSTSPNFPELFWTRQTIGPVPLPNVTLFGMGQDKVLYQRLNANMVDAIPTYHKDSLWGNVFCKRLYIGSASYHFMSPTNSYVSYQHPACRDLPPLDDDTPLPTRVDFHQLVWEPEERKLTATIEWEQDFGIFWNENVRWKLTMWFDSEYMVILKGGIQCEWCTERRARSRPPRRQNPHRPPPVAVYVPPEEPAAPETPETTPPPAPDRNEEWVMSGYGHDQLYINAAMLERYRDSTVAVDYKELAEQHGRRLKDEGATTRSIGLVNHVFHLKAEHPNSNPIDFLL